MKVLFVYRYLTMGGVEAVLRARVEGLPALGLEAHAWFLGDGEGRELFRGLESSFHVGGLNDLQRFVELWHPNVIATVDSEEILPALSDLAWPGRVVVECHTPYVENRVYLKGTGAQNAAAVLVPSRHQERAIRRDLPGHVPVRVVPNPIHEIFVGEPVVPAPLSPNPIVAWVGRLDRLKNWVAFLEIARRVHRRHPGAEYWIVGDGAGAHAAAALRREAKRRGILSRLRWFQELSQDHMPRLFDAIRGSGGVFVSTSRGESFGMAVAEAMARSCAVVVPDQGPFTEYVQHGWNGLRYRGGSTSNAVAEIGRFLEDDALRTACGERARASILEKHSPGPALTILANELKAIVGASDMS